MNESPKPKSTDKIYLEHARTAEQLHDMEDIAERGICFMCPDNIPEYYEERGGLIEEGEHSYLVHNGYPYENTEHHMMVIPKKHAERLQDLDEEFMLEAFDFLRWLEGEYDVSGGAIAMRFGNPEETGATAHHLHIHFIVPSSDISPEDDPVKFRMSRKFNTKVRTIAGKMTGKVTVVNVNDIEIIEDDRTTKPKS